MWHGSARASACPPAQRDATGAVQGGQGPSWQVCQLGAACPHGLTAAQGSVQVGGRAPQRTGGRVTVPPHAQGSGDRDSTPQGAHGPAWQPSSQACGA